MVCPDGWTKAVITGELLLGTHPELNVTRAASGNRSLTLIGFMLDPDMPDATDKNIVARLLEENSGLEALIAATVRLGGRWILVATYDENKYLFHDALGLRQAYYTNPASTDTLLVMSQPIIGAELLNLAIDDTAQQFMDSYEFRSNPEYQWPGTSTPFNEIKHLLPNHYLDLNTRSCHRYWPNRRLEKIELNDAVKQLSAIFKGLIEAAATRFDLAAAVTAGIDSRLVLAASKDVRDKITYLTVRQVMMPDDHADIVIASNLLDRLGLAHTVIKSPVTTTPEFSGRYKKNVFLAHDHYGSDAEAILKYFSRKKVVVTGSGAEVGRFSYGFAAHNYNGEITAEYLSKLERFGSNNYAIKDIQQWLDGLGYLHNINLLDLFYWEIRCGNWLAMTTLEFDIAWKDIFSLYNCRAILTLMLSVDGKHRKESEHVLFLEIIRSLWQEVLSEPINPHKKIKQARLRNRIKKRIKKIIKLTD